MITQYFAFQLFLLLVAAIAILCLFMFCSDKPPGPAYDLNFSEVRSHSLVILWKAPVYTGASAVTGYLVVWRSAGGAV